jgi:hypothetical protein
LQIAFVGEVEENELITFVARQLSINPSVFKCTLLREFPRLSNGKIDYAALGKCSKQP